MALEAIRLYEPSLFRTIRANKSDLCMTTGDREQKTKGEARFDPFLKGVEQNCHATAKIALQRLFPIMEEMSYGGDFHSQWDQERRVCDDGHFNTCFRLTLSEEKLSESEIEEFIANSDDPGYIRRKLREAASFERGSGTSMIPVLLDELTTHAQKVPKEKVQTILSVLFELHDEIDLQKDVGRGMMAYGSTTLRCRWLAQRLTERRFTLEERTEVFLKAHKNASLEWRTYFVTSEISMHQGSDNRVPREDDWLVAEDAIGGLKKDALDAIRFLITTQAKRNLSSRSGIGGVRSAT